MWTVGGGSREGRGVWTVEIRACIMTAMTESRWASVIVWKSRQRSMAARSIARVSSGLGGPGAGAWIAPSINVESAETPARRIRHLFLLLSREPSATRSSSDFCSFW